MFTATRSSYIEVLSYNFALTRVKNTVLVNRGLLYKGSTAVPVH